MLAKVWKVKETHLLLVGMQTEEATLENPEKEKYTIWPSCTTPCHRPKEL